MTKSGSSMTLLSLPDIGCRHVTLFLLTPQDHLCTLSVWWNCRQVVHYQLLPPGQTITADLYSQQLQRVHRALRQKEPALVNRKGVLVFHDNANPHMAKRTWETLQQLSWETLCHAPYLPDHAPAEYHLLYSLDNRLRGRSLFNI